MVVGYMQYDDYNVSHRAWALDLDRSQGSLEDQQGDAWADEYVLHLHFLGRFQTLFNLTLISSGCLPSGSITRYGIWRARECNSFFLKGRRMSGLLVMAS